MSPHPKKDVIQLVNTIMFLNEKYLRYNVGPMYFPGFRKSRLKYQLFCTGISTCFCVVICLCLYSIKLVYHAVLLAGGREGGHMQKTFTHYP